MTAPPLDIDGAEEAGSAPVSPPPPVPPVNQPLPPPPADDPLEQIRDLKSQVEELLRRLRLVEAQARHAMTPWAQKVFLVQPDGGNTLYSESGASYSGTNPTTTPLSDQTGTIARSFLQADLLTPATGAVGCIQYDFGTARLYFKIPGGDMRYVRLETAGGGGAYTGKLMTADGSGTLTATTNTATVYELNKTAAGYNLGTGSNCTVVSVDSKNEFRSSFPVYNGSTFVANVGGLNMGTGLASVLKFDTNGKDLILLAGNQYEVVQMDSTASKLVILPARGIP